MEETETTVEEETEEIVVENGNSGSCGAHATWVFSNGTLTISGTGPLYEDGTDSLKSSIANSVTKLVINKGITEIGDNAFREPFYNLTSVSIPNTVTRIGVSAFTGCGIESITIPSSVTSIDDSAFYYCDSLKSVSIANTNINLGKTVFYGCEKLTDSNGFCIVLNRLYQYSGSATDVVIPSNIKVIDSGAFQFTDVKSIKMGDSVTDIGEYCFWECSSLESITLSKNLKSIGVNAFENCTALKNISIPSGVTQISEYTFKGCSSLASVTLQNNLKAIAPEAFDNCTALTSITIPDTVNYIGSEAFYKCSSLNKIVLPDGIINIEKGSFSDCSALTSVTLSKNLVSIGKNAFTNCTKLTSITLPSTVQYIEFEAFKNCAFKSISLPNGLIRIGSGSFSNCSNLTSITIPEGIKSISFNAFDSCTSLNSVTIPSSLTLISNSAFKNCNNLSSVKYKGASEDFAKIKIYEYNDDFKNANISFGPGFVLDYEEIAITVGESNTNYATYYNENYEAAQVTGGVQWSVDQADGLTLTSHSKEDMYWCYFTANKVGTYVVTASTKTGFEKSFTVHVANAQTVTSPNWPNIYEVNSDEVLLEKTFINASKIQITFDSTSETEKEYDLIKILGNDDYLELSGTEMAGKSYIITGNFISINFKSDGSVQKKGFSATIIPIYETNKLGGYSVSILSNNKIGLNFYMNLTSQIKNSNNAYISLTEPNGKKTKLYVQDADDYILDKIEYKKFTCEVSAKDMTTPVKIQLYNQDKALTEEYSYTIDQAANYYLHNTSTQYAADVIKKMLSYGYYTQKYFNYHTERLPSYYEGQYLREDSKYTIVDDNDQIEFVGAKLVLKSTLAMKLYFKGNATFTVDGKTVKTTKEDEYTVITLSDNNLCEHLYVIETTNFTLKYKVDNYLTLAKNQNKTDLYNLVCATEDFYQCLYD